MPQLTQTDFDRLHQFFTSTSKYTNAQTMPEAMNELRPSDTLKEPGCEHLRAAVMGLEMPGISPSLRDRIRAIGQDLNKDFFKNPTQNYQLYLTLFNPTTDHDLGDVYALHAQAIEEDIRERLEQASCILIEIEILQACHKHGSVDLAYIEGIKQVINKYLPQLKQQSPLFDGLKIKLPALFDATIAFCDKKSQSKDAPPKWTSLSEWFEARKTDLSPASQVREHAGKIERAASNAEQHFPRPTGNAGSSSEPSRGERHQTPKGPDSGGNSNR